MFSRRDRFERGGSTAEMRRRQSPFAGFLISLSRSLSNLVHVPIRPSPLQDGIPMSLLHGSLVWGENERAPAVVEREKGFSRARDFHCLLRICARCSHSLCASHRVPNIIYCFLYLLSVFGIFFYMQCILCSVIAE